MHDMPGIIHWKHGKENEQTNAQASQEPRPEEREEMMKESSNAYHTKRYSSAPSAFTNILYLPIY